jgi:lysophospholipid acyltransferase (LPLAT)-like uncharacterized protein
VRSLIPPLLVFIVRALSCTLRFRMEDRCGVTRGAVCHPVIWAFWHQGLLMVPIARLRYTPARRGSVLTSPSKDGAILAGVMARFGIDAVRGSSSRRGSTAVRELIGVIEKGGDVAITPDGPRGPACRLGPGIVKLAEVTGAPVMPVHLRYSRYWELRSWDRFRIPKPFSRVEIVFGELHRVPSPLPDAAAFEAERLRLEAAL